MVIGGFVRGELRSAVGNSFLFFCSGGIALSRVERQTSFLNHTTGVQRRSSSSVVQPGHQTGWWSVRLSGLTMLDSLRFTKFNLLWFALLNLVNLKESSHKRHLVVSPRFCSVLILADDLDIHPSRLIEHIFYTEISGKWP